MGAPKKILIVDDEPDIRATLEARLSAAGFSTSSASDGAEALRIVDAESPDLILLDIMMPKMSGGEFKSALNKRPRSKDIPVIMISALRRPSEQKSSGPEVGGNVIFSKPYDFEELLRAIRELI